MLARGLSLLVLLLALWVAPSVLAQGTPAAEPAGLSELPPVVSEADASATFAAQQDTSADRTLWWLGRFHPLVVHFPIALILVAAFAELLFALRGRSVFADGARFCLAMGTASSIVAAALGWAAHETTLYSEAMADTVERHEWLGFVTVGCSIVTLILSIRANRPGAGVRSERIYRGALLVTCLAVGFAGHFGGTLVYGPDHFG